MSMIINTKTGEAVIKGRKYYLTRYEINLLNELNKPGIRTYEELCKAMYGVEPIKNADGSTIDSERKRIATMVCRVKKKTKVNIIVRREFGYELFRGYEL